MDIPADKKVRKSLSLPIDGETPKKRPNHSPAPVTQSPAKPKTQVDVHESYELGYLINSSTDDQEVYVFDIFNGLNVNYQAKVENVNIFLSDYRPLMLAPAKFDQLQQIAEDAFNKIAKDIQDFIEKLSIDTKNEFVRQQIEAHNRLVKLRSQIFTIILTLVPDLNLPDNFDYSGIDLDNLLHLLITQMARGERQDRETLVKFATPPVKAKPLVTSCKDPYECLKTLQERIMTFIGLSLPDFKVPKEFVVTRDLPDLLNSIYSYNLST